MSNWKSKRLSRGSIDLKFKIKNVTSKSKKHIKNANKYDINKSLNKIGYKIKNKISETLQGSVYLGKNINTNKIVCIKVTSQKLHTKGIGNGITNKVKVQENIIKEVSIMKYLQNKSPPKGFIGVEGFYKDERNYILVMDYGGTDLFDYVGKMTKYVKSGKLKLNDWIEHVKKLYKQMCYYVNWLHKSNVCHLDISLENCLIQNGVIYFCDFGLAEVFNDNQFKCKKYVGKPNYKSPEIHRKKGCFNAKKADVWSLGVCLFMMLCGVPLYKKASLSDPYYCNLKMGYLREMVKLWGLSDMLNDDAYDLLGNILKSEKDRYTIKQILQHPFMSMD